MRRRKKWLASLCCGVTLLAVAACTRPVTTTVTADATSANACGAETPTGAGQVNSVTARGTQGEQPAEGSKAGSGKAESTGAGFEFPGDQGGTLLKRLLTPRDTVASTQGQSAPLRRKPLARVENPTSPLSGFDPTLPRVSLYGPVIPARPTFVIPESILGDAGLTLALPEVQTMPTGPLLKQPSVDVNKPMSLAPLAQPLSSREPTTDPTRGASATAATKAAMPVRTTPAPFVPESLPDPFENEAAVRKLAPPGDETLPLGSSSQAPRR